METPDLTKIDLGVVAALAAAFGAGLRGGEFYAVCAVACALVLADTIRRHGRAGYAAAAAYVDAEAPLAGVPASSPDPLAEA